MIIRIEIPSDQEESFISDFLAARPIPLDEEGSPSFTVEEWIKKNATDILNNFRRRGALKRYNEGYQPPPDVTRDNVVIE